MNLSEQNAPSDPSDVFHQILTRESTGFDSIIARIGLIPDRD